MGAKWVENKRERHLLSIVHASVIILVVIMILTSPASVWSSDLMIPLELPEINMVGAGVGAYPDYLGSDEYSLGVAPLGSMSLGGGRFISILASDFRINLLNSPNWRLGPEFVWRFGREDVEDEIVNKVHEIDDSPELGVFGGYRWFDPKEMRKQAGVGVWGVYDVSSAHGGWTAGGSIYGMLPVAMPLTIAAGAGFTYGSDDYMDAYFSVTDQDTLASGLAPYIAGAGVRDGRGWMIAMIHFSRHWHAGAALMYSRLIGEAADSPLVGERGSEHQWVYGVGALYSW